MPPRGIRRILRIRAKHNVPRREFTSLPQFFPQPPVNPHQRAASTSANPKDWVSWLKKASSLSSSSDRTGGKALLFAGLGSYPHTPLSPTPSSINVWEQASEALLNPDMTIGYETWGMEEFAGGLGGGRGIRGWLRGWVEGRSLDELMARADVTAAFILSSSIAILASEQEKSGSNSLLPFGTSHLVGHGFIGTLTALVAAGRLDLPTGVRLARIYANLPENPSSSRAINTRKHLTTVLSARSDVSHSLSPPEAESSSAPAKRRRAMQLVLDEVHGLQKEWVNEGTEDWAEAGIINSSKVCVITGTQSAVHQIVDRLQQMYLANPVMDVNMPCPYHTKLMDHALPKFRSVLDRCFLFNNSPQITILDPVTTKPISGLPLSLADHLTHQLRWHKTLSKLYDPNQIHLEEEPSTEQSLAPSVKSFLTVGRGAKGLGIMLKSEIKRCAPGSGIGVEEFGVGDERDGRRGR